MPFYEYVYFIQVVPDGAIKIGRAGNPEQRLRGLQTASPFALEIKALIRSCKAGVDEAALHQDLAEHRLNGEWFSPHPDVLAFVNGARELEKQLRLRDMLGDDSDRRRLIKGFRSGDFLDWTGELDTALGIRTIEEEYPSGLKLMRFERRERDAA